MSVRVRVRDNANMYAEVQGSPPSQYRGKIGTVEPDYKNLDGYDVAVRFEGDGHGTLLPRFMWYELEVLT